VPGSSTPLAQTTIISSSSVQEIQDALMIMNYDDYKGVILKLTALYANVDVAALRKLRTRFLSH
jgi:hypothetical protein